ncbi:hypothetical protein BDZ45DRAFT_690814 [Acephala macrosclerotiorum]|nr:hypothetical protein BDZ45DRAFT_690814 [Acephala macrosclerotiorum]
MADMDLEHSGLQEVANAMRGDDGSVSNAQKRKRDSESADDTRRGGNKRISPNNTGKDQHDGVIEALQDYNSLHQLSDNHNGSAEHASTAAAALAGIYPTMTVPQPTDLSFGNPGSDSDRNPESSFMDNSQQQDSFSMDTSTPSGGRSSNKPAVGSDEWHKVRKDNHKEVERRRRETINEGINELAKIVPGCEKNKGSILQRAVQFITQLKENETQNIEKWTLEKLLTEQAIAELSASNDKLKAECERAWREVETWKKTCQSAGLAPKKEDGSGDN